MPTYLRTSSSSHPLPATDSDRALLIRSHSHPPGIRGLLKIPVDPIYNFAILVMNVITYCCVMHDLTVVLGLSASRKTMSVMREGTGRSYIFCFDIIFSVELIAAICYKKSKLKHARHALLIILDVCSMIPLETIYIIMKGDSIRVFYILRLRYILRFGRYMKMLKPTSRFRLSIQRVILSYTLIISGLCVFLSCLRLHMWCNLRGLTNDIIRCENITSFDFFFTFTIVNSHMTFSGTIFSNSSFAMMTNIDGIIQVVVFMSFCFLVCKIICIIIEMNYLKFTFCLAGNSVRMELARESDRNSSYVIDPRFKTLVYDYMINYWRFYQVENLQSSYVGNYRVATMPAIIHSDLSLDISWNMFKHSLLFCKETTAFLRHVSRYARFTFGSENDVIYNDGDLRSRMIYIQRGVMTIMSELTGLEPLMSFSGGTCFGELSLFMHLPSTTTIFCSTYCEYIELSMSDFSEVRNVYPLVYAKLRMTCLNRIKLAQKYDYLGRYMYENKMTELPKAKTSLRYIKATLRKFTQMPPSGIGKNIALPSNMRPEESFGETIFNAEFISLYVMADEIESNLSTHFTAGGWNFKLKPTSTLVGMWRFVINFIVIVDCIFMPISLTNESDLFSLPYDYFVVVIRIAYLLDFLSYNFIGVSTPDKYLNDSESILMHKIQTKDFWMDLTGCLPLESIVKLMEGPMAPYRYRMYGLNRLVKIYKVFNFMDDRLYFQPAFLVLSPILKSLYGLVLLSLFGYLIFVRYGYFELLNKPVMQSIMFKFCIVYQFYFASADIGMVINRDVAMVPMICLQTIGFITFVIGMSIMSAYISLLYMPVVEYENMTADLKRVYVLYKFQSMPRKRMNKYLKMQYYSGVYLVDKTRMKKMMSLGLYKQYSIDRYYAFISSLGLFQQMSKAATRSMCSLGSIMLIPQGELIATAGGLVTQVYFIIAGTCVHITHNTVLSNNNWTGLDHGEALLILEAFLGTYALNNILAVTDCKLLCVPVHTLRRELSKYPDELKMIKDALHEAVPNHVLKNLKPAEPPMFPSYEKGESCRYFSNRQREHKVGFGKCHFLHNVFMKVSITPFGRFWVSWEIAHIIVTYTYAIIGSHPRSVVVATESVLFWLFRGMDFFYLIDIFLRHHLIYFNSDNIEVQHPWKCAIHFWTTSFWIDIISTVPVELVVLPIVTEISETMLSLLRMNKYLRLYRFFGLRNFFKAKYMKTYKLELILSFAAPIILVTITMLNVLLHPNEMVKVDGVKLMFRHNPRYWMFYASLWNDAFSEICSVSIFERYVPYSRIKLHALMNILGVVSKFTLTCMLIGISLFRRVHLMTYQIKMQRLLQFMNLGKIDRKLRNEAIKHYEYIWKIREGKELGETTKLFKSSPNDIEVIYSFYAPVLQRTLLFVNAPKIILKDLLAATALDQLSVLITGIVLRVNDVQDRIFIIFHGTVEVLAPDYGSLRELRVGSLFGCLDNIPSHRSTLTYVAKTHCEFLTIPSVKFHEVIRKYPHYASFYTKLLRTSNYDYVPSIPKRKKQGWEASQANLPPKEITKFATKLVRKLFPVLKPKEWLNIAFCVYITTAFLFDCMIICDLYKYVEYIWYWAYLSDAIFWIKVYIDFSTQYEDTYGLMVQSRRKIALRYIKKKTGFIFQAICNFPIELIFMLVPWAHQHNSVWAKLRCNRLLKILLVYEYLQSTRKKLNVNTTLVKVMEILLIAFTMLQFSCIVLSHVVDFNYLELFLLSSCAVTKKLCTPFGLNEKIGLGKLEDHILYTIVHVPTHFITVYILSQCVAAYSSLNFGNFRYETFAINQEKAMHAMNVSRPLIARVKRYCNTLREHGRNVQFPSFVITAPYYLREGLLNSLFGVHLRKHPIFQKCHADFIRQVAANFKTLYFFVDDFIAYQGDIDRKIYFIHYGEVEGVIEDNLYYDVSDSKYTTGDYFGFHQLLYVDVGHERSYKVVSDTALILELKRSQVMNLLDFFPASKDVFFNSKAGNDNLAGAEDEMRDYSNYTKDKHV